MLYPNPPKRSFPKPIPIVNAEHDDCLTVDPYRRSGDRDSEKSQTASHFQNTHTWANAKKFEKRLVREAIQPRQPLLFAGRRSVNICDGIVHRVSMGGEYIGGRGIRVTLIGFRKEFDQRLRTPSLAVPLNAGLQRHRQGLRGKD